MSPRSRHQPSGRRRADGDLPSLPQLDDMAPLAAWLSRHLLKVILLLLILLALCLAWLLRSYGFRLDADGLQRTPSETHLIGRSGRQSRPQASRPTPLPAEPGRQTGSTPAPGL